MLMPRRLRSAMLFLLEVSKYFQATKQLGLPLYSLHSRCLAPVLAPISPRRSKHDATIDALVGSCARAASSAPPSPQIWFGDGDLLQYVGNAFRRTYEIPTGHVAVLEHFGERVAICQLYMRSTIPKSSGCR